MTVTAATPVRSDPRGVLLARFTLAGLLAFAAVMHAVLTPEHFEHSTLMGAGFVAATVVELTLAMAVILAPITWVYAATIVVAAGLIGMYAWNVMIGLPFVQAAETAAHEEGAAHEEASHGGHQDGLVIGAGEPVDAAGAVTKGAELGSIALAGWLITRRPGRSRDLA